ncbi:MAG: methyltransferase [Clostridia bacterium]|nr:methyltransferase [Clostridia bacterium]
MEKVLQDLDGTHRIYQYRNGFSFGTDAVLLAGMIRCRRGSIGVELGTGTGIIPLLLSIHKEFQKIYALEIQPEYARLAEENIAINGFSERVEVVCGDLKEAARLVPSPCDFVFSNPPYMKENTGKTADDPGRRIARHEVMCNVDDVCRSASSLLQDKGEFFCVYRFSRLTELFRAMQKYQLEPKNLILVTPKKSSPPELILVRSVKGAKPYLRTRPVLILQDENGEKTPEIQALYQNGILNYDTEMR